MAAFGGPSGGAAVPSVNPGPGRAIGKVPGGPKGKAAPSSAHAPVKLAGSLMPSTQKAQRAPKAPSKAPTRAPAAPAMAGPGVPSNSPLLNPNATLSGKPLYQAAVALANAQYNPAIQGLQGQAQQNDQQAANASAQTNGYFTNLGQFVNQGNQQIAQNNQTLNDQLQQSAASQAAALQQIGTNATQSLLAYAPQAYGNNSLATPALADLQTNLAKQQGLASQMSQNYQNFGAQQGADYANLGASNLGSFAMAGQQDLANIQRGNVVRNEPIMSKIAALQQSRGALIGTDVGKLRQQEIANQISRAGLGIKQQSANAASANAASNAANAQTNTGKAAATAAYQQGQLSQGQQKINQSQQKINQTAAQNAFNNDPTRVGSAAWQRVQTATGKAWSDNPNAVGSPAWARTQSNSAKIGHGGVAKPLSTNENNIYWGKTSTVEQLIKDGQAHGGTMAQIVDGLTTGNNPAKTKFDGYQVQIAQTLLQYGYINQQQAQTLRNQYGVTGGTYNGQPIKVGAPPQQPTSPLALTGSAIPGAITSPLSPFH